MGMVSFISTVPSLPALPPLPSPPTITTSAIPRYPIHASTIGCKIEADNASETQFGRRDVLKCFGATIGMEIIASSGSFVEEAYAADLIQRRQRSEFQSNVKVTLSAAIKGNPDLIPSILTLAMNDAMTYDKWGLFDRQFGRLDAQQPDPEGRVPQWEKASVQEMKDKFSAIGLGPRQLAVMSAFLGPDQMATETLLATDQDVAPWVEKYQRSRETISQTDYEVDLITTFTKLSSLGQQINYEAYTYPVQKVDLSKLKL